MDGARERFLRAIVERIPAERIAELHLFPPLRQAGRETGVAVVAAWPEEEFVQGELPPPVGLPEEPAAPEPHPDDAAAIEATPAEGPPASRDSLAAAGAPHPEDAESIAAPPEAEATEEFWEPEPVAEEASGADADAAGGRAPPVRLIVYRAGYRWTLKGADRGKWEVDLRAEADAPLEAVGAVVRGVHRRAGGEAEPERLSGDAVRAALSDRPWAATT